MVRWPHYFIYLLVEGEHTYNVSKHIQVAWDAVQVVELLCMCEALDLDPSKMYSLPLSHCQVWLP